MRLQFIYLVMVWVRSPCGLMMMHLSTRMHWEHVPKSQDLFTQSRNIRHVACDPHEKDREACSTMP